MSTTDEIMALVKAIPHGDRCPRYWGDVGECDCAQAAIEARVAALVAERDKAVANRREALIALERTREQAARAMKNELPIRMKAASERIAALEAENRALREAGKVLVGRGWYKGLLSEGEGLAIDLFNEEPGALAAWQAREVE